MYRRLFASSRFLSRVVVMDAQSRVKYYFFCKRWLALDTHEHNINEVFSIADKGDIVTVTNLFLINSLRSETLLILLLH